MYYFGHLELALGDLLHRSLRLSRRSAKLLLPRVMYAAKLDMIEAIIPMLNQPDSWKSEARRIVDDCRKFIDVTVLLQATPTTVLFGLTISAQKGKSVPLASRTAFLTNNVRNWRNSSVMSAVSIQVFVRKIIF